MFLDKSELCNGVIVELVEVYDTVRYRFDTMYT